MHLLAARGMGLEEAGSEPSLRDWAWNAMSYAFVVLILILFRLKGGVFSTSLEGGGQDPKIISRSKTARVPDRRDCS
jgi:hypothetical protein